MGKLLKVLLLPSSDWSKRWPDQDAMRNLDENGSSKVQDGAGSFGILIHERRVKAVGHEPSMPMRVFQQQSMCLVNEYYLGAKYSPSRSL